MENESEHIQWEFFVIGNRVPWNEAQSICPIYGHLNPLPAFEEQEIGFLPDSLTRRTNTGSTLAVLDEDTKDWLARMLLESNYHRLGYDVYLWIGGRRMDSNSNWTWIDTGKKGDTFISDSLMIGDYSVWNIADNNRNDENNCLTFDRLNHDALVLVPDICRHRKPFICMRSGKGRLSRATVFSSMVNDTHCIKSSMRVEKSLKPRGCEKSREVSLRGETQDCSVRRGETSCYDFHQRSGHFYSECHAPEQTV